MELKTDFIIPICVLTAICLVISAILVPIYGVTAPVIAENNIKAANEARMELLEGSSGFEKVDAGQTENLVDVYRENSGKGYVITTNSKGYGGTMVVMTGINSEGAISGVKILEANETPGLGSKVSKTDYLEKYNGATGTEVEGVDKVAGASISSKALKKAVQLAFEVYQTVEEEK